MSVGYIDTSAAAGGGGAYELGHMVPSCCYSHSVVAQTAEGYTSALPHISYQWKTAHFHIHIKLTESSGCAFSFSEKSATCQLLKYTNRKTASLR
ncbi:hypothetical protein LDENG_00240630 [Lucifuga dentata]|nr:hypothetical protein LDENG_00240630 [Lucifuga dentata]